MFQLIDQSSIRTVNAKLSTPLTCNMRHSILQIIFVFGFYLLLIYRLNCVSCGGSGLILRITRHIILILWLKKMGRRRWRIVCIIDRYARRDRTSRGGFLGLVVGWAQHIHFIVAANLHHLPSLHVLPEQLLLHLECALCWLVEPRKQLSHSFLL